MHLIYHILLTVSTIYPAVIANVMCREDTFPRVPKYHLIEKCHRSKLGIAAKANYNSLASCLKLGVEKKALALNFSPPEASGDGEPVDYTCEVLKCSESEGGLSLENDTRYDYYSIYARPIPSINSTCVPATGMFQLLQKRLNHSQRYSQAELECRNISGALADAASEQRTDALAQLLAGASVDAAHVYMARNNGSDFYLASGDPLECTTYRAWAPGHPKRNPVKYGCVALTRRRMWQTVPCGKPYPGLCELIPGGPYKRNTIFISKTDNINKIEGGIDSVDVE